MSRAKRTISIISILSILLCIKYATSMLPHGILILNRSSGAGTLRQGESVPYHVKVINLSMSSIYLTTFSSCGCTVIEDTKTPIPPFSSYVIKATVTTEDLSRGTYNRHLELVFESGTALWTEPTEITFKIV